jgi:tetratricopeptide (TPR) repeat protein
MDCYEKAIEINPNYSRSHNNLGVIFQNFGYYQKGVDCYKKAIEIDPNFIDAHYNLGGAFKKLDEYQKAMNCYKKAIKINPNYADAHYNLGIILKELGKNQKAIDCYEKAIEIDPNYVNAHNNLGGIFLDLEEYQKAKDYFEKALEIDPNNLVATINIPSLYINQLIDLDKIISLSFKSLKLNHKTSKFINQTVPLFRLKHDVQQAQYLISKDYKLEGIKEFQKIGDGILTREENKEDENNSNQKILLTSNEINSLLPFYKSDHVYKPKKISGSCINPNKNWQDVEDEYFNSSNQIMYIDDFLSEEALQELREFCLVSKVWITGYNNNKYFGAFSPIGFITPIHLQIAIDLKQKLPKLFGPHRLSKFWGFKYDSNLGKNKGLNIHADLALHNLNFWITPDEYNNNKNSGGLKVYDAPAPDNWTYEDHANKSNDEIYKFLKDQNVNCTNVPYKCNRAVLFNSAYFHVTDEIDFKDVYEGRRTNNTYLFGDKLVK